MKRMLFRFGGVFFLSVLLTACGAIQTDDDQAGNQTDIQNIKQLVHEYSAGNFSDGVQASITADQLIVVDEEGDKQVYDLPEDEFFVSIAPYINHTHP